MKGTFVKTLILAGLAALATSCGAQLGNSKNTQTAFAVSTSTLKGANIPHAWFASRTDQALTDLKAWGSNTARIVLATGCRWTKTPSSEVATIISKAKTLGYSSLILEVHDTTGYGEDSAGCSLANATTYWNEIKSVLTGHENFVIINIGNEPYGNNNTANWVTDTKTAIQTMRNNGFTHTLMVDAPNWGQDWSFTMRDNAASVRAADTRNDVIFDVHMYGVFDTAAEVQAYMKSFSDRGIPLVVGEFGMDHSDGAVDEVAIAQYSKQYNIGVLGWSWSGNGTDLGYLDLVSNWSSSSPTTWGTWFKNNILTGSSPSPTASVSLSASATSITSGTSVTLTATPSVANTTVSSVEFLSGTTVLGTDTSSPYTFTVSPTATTSYSARVNTAAGVSATSSTVTVTVGGSAPSTLCIVCEGFASDWSNWSWSTDSVDANNTTPVKTGSKSVKVDLKGSGVFSPRKGTAQSTSGYTKLTFQINLGTNSSMPLKVWIRTADESGDSTAKTLTVSGANTWQLVTVNLSEIGNPSSIKRINIQNNSTTNPSAIYIDDLQFSN